jgi:signal transduction histidine kinase
MMDLTRPRRPKLTLMDLAELSREVVDLAASSGRASTDVDVRYEGPPNLMVQADGAMLRQLAWNLVRNAVQASSPGEAVRVVVREREDGRGELSVIDNGVGIDEQARAHLFDAFFTTRSHGTGVGLAVVKRIVDDHGFEIVVESGAEGGATFRVTLSETEPLGAESSLVSQISNTSA